MSPSSSRSRPLCHVHLSSSRAGYAASRTGRSAPVDVFSDETKLASCIHSAIASKQWGNEDLFASKIAQVCGFGRATRASEPARSRAIEAAAWLPRNEPIVKRVALAVRLCAGVRARDA